MVNCFAEKTRIFSQFVLETVFHFGNGGRVPQFNNCRMGAIYYYLICDENLLNMICSLDPNIVHLYEDISVGETLLCNSSLL